MFSVVGGDRSVALLFTVVLILIIIGLSTRNILSFTIVSVVLVPLGFWANAYRCLGAFPLMLGRISAFFASVDSVFHFHCLCGDRSLSSGFRPWA
jgi:hypothetical protein